MHTVFSENLYIFANFGSTKQLLNSRQMSTYAENLHRSLKLLHRRIGRRYSEVFVLGVLSVGICSASIGYDNSGILAQLIYSRGAAGERIKAYKIPAFGR